MTEPLLTARDIGVRRGRRDVLAHVSLSLIGGESVAVLGPSGSGKSTFIKALVGLHRLSSGHVTLDGAAVDARSWQGNLGYVPQDDIVHSALKVEQALGFAAQLRLGPGDHWPRLDTVLRQLGLSDHRHQRIATLSGGQRKRVSIAQELLSQPQVLVLDEPTSGLDPALEAGMMALLASLAGQGALVLATTHAMASLHRMSRVLVIFGGHLVYDGPPDQLAAYFGVPAPERIFQQLQKASPAEWFNRFVRQGGRRGGGPS
jgi:ABC-type multidrug transport system ATPase subunit